MTLSELFDKADEMVEELVEEETENWADISIPDGPYTVTYDSPSMNDSMNKNNIHNEIILPKGYIFKDENGNEINAQKIVLEKKKKEYPKTYEECCEVLFEDISYAEFTFVPAKISSVNLSYIKGDFITDLPSKVIPYKEKLNIFYKLLICRDAYWKLYGDEMGLGEPWKPDWSNLECDKFCIWVDVGDITLIDVFRCQHILAFPTPQMRDQFYENFKKEIEICKELL